MIIILVSVDVSHANEEKQILTKLKDRIYVDALKNVGVCVVGRNECPVTLRKCSELHDQASRVECYLPYFSGYLADEYRCRAMNKGFEINTKVCLMDAEWHRTIVLDFINKNSGPLDKEVSIYQQCDESSFYKVSTTIQAVDGPLMINYRLYKVCIDFHRSMLQKNAG
jgi:hypothetical protein